MLGRHLCRHAHSCTPRCTGLAPRQGHTWHTRHPAYAPHCHSSRLPSIYMGSVGSRGRSTTWPVHVLLYNQARLIKCNGVTAHKPAAAPDEGLLREAPQKLVFGAHARRAQRGSGPGTHAHLNRMAMDGGRGQSGSSRRRPLADDGEKESREHGGMCKRLLSACVSGTAGTGQ